MLFLHLLFWNILEKQMIHGSANQQQRQECKIVQGEASDVIAGATGIVLHILPESDQTGKGGNQGTDSADVYADQQICVIAGKLGQEDGGGNIADALAGQGTEEEGVLFKQLRKQLTDRLDPCHVSCEYKEEYEGEEQGIVYHFQCFAVCKQQSGGNYQQTDPIGDHTEDDDNRQCEEGQVQCGTLRLQGDLFVIYGKGFGFDKETAYRDQQYGNGKGNDHDAYELTGRDPEFGIQIQVLGVAEGGQHTA